MYKTRDESRGVTAASKAHHQDVQHSSEGNSKKKNVIIAEKTTTSTTGRQNGQKKENPTHQPTEGRRTWESSFNLNQHQK